MLIFYITCITQFDHHHNLIKRAVSTPLVPFYRKTKAWGPEKKKTRCPWGHFLSSFHEVRGWTFPRLGKCLTSRSTSAHPNFQIILGRLCWINSMVCICKGAWKACVPGSGISCDVAAMHCTQLFIVLNFIFQAVGFLSHLLNSQIWSLLDH